MIVEIECFESNTIPVNTQSAEAFTENVEAFGMGAKLFSISLPSGRDRSVILLFLSKKLYFFKASDKNSEKTISVMKDLARLNRHTYFLSKSKDGTIIYILTGKRLTASSIEELDFSLFFKNNKENLNIDVSEDIGVSFITVNSLKPVKEKTQNEHKQK